MGLGFVEVDVSGSITRLDIHLFLKKLINIFFVEKDIVNFLKTWDLTMSTFIDILFYFFECWKLNQSFFKRFSRTYLDCSIIELSLIILVAVKNYKCCIDVVL